MGYERDRVPAGTTVAAMTVSAGTDFCPGCGGSLVEQFVSAEGRDRLVCTQCARIHYVNPAPVAGTIPVSDGRLWLLQRGIEPRLGYWTFPAGFMEMGETVEEAACRETREELNLEVRLRGLIGVYSYATGTTIHIVYAADALTEPSAGEETLAFAAFLPQEIPWSELAFASTRDALQDWIRAAHGTA
ncbi:MAG TPA: NUDIX hydrolase [Chloroflexota bacterium]|nr:NUDIX hydrolase [Chloroflexota bacterium]